MTNDESAAAAAEVPTPEEARLFEFLERYLDSLHSGDVVSRSVLIERHPELARCVRCIELLDRLARNGSRRTRPTRPRSRQLRNRSASTNCSKRSAAAGWGWCFARQTDLDRLVAIKMILSSRLASADDVGRFHAEAKAAGSLRHPNIVAIHDAGEVHGQHFFAMDFVEARSHRLSPPELSSRSRRPSAWPPSARPSNTCTSTTSFTAT